VKRLSSFDYLSILNFTLVIHEIMTRFFSSESIQKIVDYIISYDVMVTLFKIVTKNENM